MTSSVLSMIMTPSDFVALLNQTLEFAYPIVVIEGELANFRISKNRWVYFDIKDENASIRCFGTVYSLPGPLENGMTLRISALPRLHPQFGFSLNFQTISLSGEGTIKKAFDLLQKQLSMEGLFDIERKRLLPYPPEKIGLIASAESAAYGDFIKIIGTRWGGLEINLADVQVQGENASGQIIRAIEWFNSHNKAVDVIVIIRGGGSMDDLQVFNNELVTRAVAASRIPTIAAIGHERDVTLVELAADVRASTPSNAAEILVPDRREAFKEVQSTKKELLRSFILMLDTAKQELSKSAQSISEAVIISIDTEKNRLKQVAQIIGLLNPKHILKRGYAIVKSEDRIVRTSKLIKAKDKLTVDFIDGQVSVEVR